MSPNTVQESRSQAIKPVKNFSLEIVYNGITKSLDANPNAAVEAALQHAIKLFGITQNPHVLSFFTTANVELADNRSFADQMIESESLLLLRPSTVKGGLK